MPEVSHHNATLHYDIAGASGEPILFVQGVGVIGNGWKPQVDGLAATHRVATFDNRGIGQSTATGRDKLTVEQMADDAAAILDAVGWDSAHVVGHSLGGVIAQRLALRHRRRVRSLTLMCTVARGADATRLTARMLALGLRTRIGTRAMRRQAFLDMVFTPEYLATQDRPALAASLAPVFGRDLADSPPIIMRQLGALRGHDTSAELPTLAGIPTLVINATHDPIAPPLFGKPLAERIPGARYVEIADASHAVPIQQAARINAMLSDFVASSRR